MTREPAKSKDSLIEEEEVCVCFSIRRAARVITQIYDDMMRPLGYRATQVQLLGLINNFEPITVNRLAEVTETDRTTLTRNLKLLEKEDLVCVEPGEDRRERRVRLSDQGKLVLQTAYPVWKKTQDQIAEAVGRNRLHKLLGDLSAALQRIREK